MRPFVLFLSLIMSLSPYLNGKIRLLTFHHNRPDFVELQKKSFDKFLQDEYEMIVFNDARSEDMAGEIDTVCKRYNLKSVRIKQKWHEEQTPVLEDIANWSLLGGKASAMDIRHCDAIRHALDHYGYGHNDIVGVIDGDIFLIRPLSIRAQMRDSQIIGSRKTDTSGSIEFFSGSLVFFDPNKIPEPLDFSLSLEFINNAITPVGGSSYKYLNTHKDLPVNKYDIERVGAFRYFDGNQLTAKGFSPAEQKLITTVDPNVELHMNRMFIKYGPVNAHKDRSSKSLDTDRAKDDKLKTVSEFFSKIML